MDIYKYFKNFIFVFVTFFVIFYLYSCTKKVSPASPIIPTKTNVPTATNTSTIIMPPTYTETQIIIMTNTLTPTISFSPAFSWTYTPTVTQTISQTEINIITDTVTATQTQSNTEVLTQTYTEKIQITFTYTYTVTFTDTNTVQWTATLTATHTVIATLTHTPTLTITIYLIFTPTATSAYRGNVTLVPTQVYSETYGNQFVFTYTAGDIEWASWPSYGTLRIKIPDGWSPPSLSSTAPGAFSVSVVDGVLYGRGVDGNDILVKIRNLQPGTGKITVIYGNTSSGPGAYVVGDGLVVIPVEVDEDGEDTSELVSSPLVNIIPATPTITPTYTPIIGEGTMTVLPVSVVSGTCGNTFEFTYNAGKSNWTTGRLKIKIPDGWSTPSLSGTAPGYFEVTETNAAWVGHLQEGQYMIIDASSLPAYTGYIKIQYGYKGAGGPGACVSGTGFVTIVTETGIDGIITYEINDSPEIELIPPSPTITVTFTISPTHSITPTITQTWTITETQTISPTHTITETHTVSPTITVTPTFTVSPTSTSTPTPFWTVVGIKGCSTGEVEDISLFVYNAIPYVVYKDRAYTDRLTLLRYVTGNWSALGGYGFSPGISYKPSLFVYAGVPYVGFRDYNDNTNKATVMRYVTGSGWEYVGSRGFTDGGAYNPSLFVYGDAPYFAFRDAANGDRASLMRYQTPVGWFYQGNQGFSDGTASSISLFFNSTNNNPYVAFKDWYNGGKISVKMYNGSDWIYVGPPGFSDGAVEYVNLFIYSGIPYVAYMDVINGNKITVKKYDSSSWINIGSQGFSSGRAEYISLFVYNGVPSVAARDSGYDDRAVVYKYSDISGQWDLFAIVSDAVANYVVLFIDAVEGKPYVAFRDENQGGRLTVMKYEGVY